MNIDFPSSVMIHLLMLTKVSHIAKTGNRLGLTAGFYEYKQQGYWVLICLEGSLYIAQTEFKLALLLPQPDYWDYCNLWKHVSFIFAYENTTIIIGFIHYSVESAHKTKVVQFQKNEESLIRTVFHVISHDSKITWQTVWAVHVSVILT